MYNTFCRFFFFCFFLLSDSKAICNYSTALFFLKARKLDDIKLINIKKVLTSLGVPLPKGQHFTLENYAILLGKEFFDRVNVRRIDEWKVITKRSLDLNWLLNWNWLKMEFLQCNGTQPGPLNLFQPITRRVQNKRIGVRSFRTKFKWGQIWLGILMRKAMWKWIVTLPFKAECCSFSSPKRQINIFWMVDQM